MKGAVAALVAALAAGAADPLPEGNAYVRGLAARQRQRAEVLDTYTYDLVSVREDLDGKGRVTRRRTQVYETFLVGGRPGRRLVSEDGRPLNGKQRARADREVEDRAEAIRKGQAAEERPGARLLVITRGHLHKGGGERRRWGSDAPRSPHTPHRAPSTALLIRVFINTMRPETARFRAET